MLRCRLLYLFRHRTRAPCRCQMRVDTVRRYVLRLCDYRSISGWNRCDIAVKETWRQVGTWILRCFGGACGTVGRLATRYDTACSASYATTRRIIQTHKPWHPVATTSQLGHFDNGAGVAFLRHTLGVASSNVTALASSFSLGTGRALSRFHTECLSRW
ncbi:hypothetical protein N657DRAFT_311367 [Parathielavia appendiculata]|uniref:Uncharacterized protein n=1 Tax=Parathielavia appendiculata TaxID=2587402 RepID=A0AAN6U5J5_9PEZI|nr:hypothetical protein N657DRAFT_311367 [Parathielavia appendiculata]